MKKDLLVICPYCGAEYLPGEIFVPKYTLGQPYYVEKTQKGKIKQFQGIAPDYWENYNCDVCLNTFSVHAKISYSTRGEEVLNKNNYSTKLKKDVFYLNED